MPCHGMFRQNSIVVPSMLKTVTPVGASNKTQTCRGFHHDAKNSFIIKWWIVLTKRDFPQPLPTVTNKCNGKIFFGASEDEVLR